MTRARSGQRPRGRGWKSNLIKLFPSQLACQSVARAGGSRGLTEGGGRLRTGGRGKRNAPARSEASRPYPNSQDAKSTEPEQPEGPQRRARCERQPMVALGRSDVRPFQ